jgi:hypothetical protein
MGLMIANRPRFSSAHCLPLSTCTTLQVRRLTHEHARRHPRVRPIPHRLLRVQTLLSLRARRERQRGRAPPRTRSEDHNQGLRPAGCLRAFRARGASRREQVSIRPVLLSMDVVVPFITQNAPDARPGTGQAPIRDARGTLLFLLPPPLPRSFRLNAAPLNAVDPLFSPGPPPSCRVSASARSSRPCKYTSRPPSRRRPATEGHAAQTQPRRRARAGERAPAPGRAGRRRHHAHHRSRRRRASWKGPRGRGR